VQENQDVMFLKVTPTDGLALEIKFHPTFWECPLLMGFTYHIAQNKIYYEPNLCKS